MEYNRRRNIKFKLLFFIVLALVVCGCILGYNYYTNSYLPEKQLNDAISDVKSKFNSDNDSIKAEYAFYLLEKNHKWGYDGVNDADINLKLKEYQDSSFRYIEAKAFAGEPEMQYLLGKLYYWGDKRYNFVNTDEVKAAYWWNEAAKNGYIKAFNSLGIAYKKGIGVEVDLVKAVEYLKKGAEAGDDMAQMNYGDLFLDGVKVKVGSHKETRKNVGYYRGNHNRKIREYFDFSIHETVTIYEVDVDDYEELIPVDLEQAKNWWQKSAEQGNLQAKDKLQKIYQ